MGCKNWTETEAMENYYGVDGKNLEKGMNIISLEPSIVSVHGFFLRHLLILLLLICKVIKLHRSVNYLLLIPTFEKTH